MQHNVAECAKCAEIHTSQPFLRYTEKLLHWACYQAWLALTETVKTTHVSPIEQRRPA